MIDWISEWLKNIIAIVLFASFIDLLLPNSNIQKYARMVLSLLVILTILSPILNVFFKDISITNIISQIENQTTAESATTMETLDNQNLSSQSYQGKIIKQVETQMTENLTELLADKFDVSVDSLKLYAQTNQDQWKIEQVDISLIKGKKSKEYKGDSSNVKEVETVNIRIENPAPDLERKSKDDTEEQAMSKEIKKLLQNQWGIPADIIVINYYS